MELKTSIFRADPTIKQVNGKTFRMTSGDNQMKNNEPQLTSYFLLCYTLHEIT